MTLSVLSRIPAVTSHAKVSHVPLSCGELARMLSKGHEVGDQVIELVRWNGMGLEGRHGAESHADLRFHEELWMPPGENENAAPTQERQRHFARFG